MHWEMPISIVPAVRGRPSAFYLPAVSSDSDIGANFLAARIAAIMPVMLDALARFVHVQQS